MGQAIQFLLFARWMPETHNAALGTLPGSQGFCGYRCGAGFGHDAWGKRCEIAAVAGGAACRPENAQTLAPVVDGDFCAVRFLESRAWPFRAAHG